MRAVMLPDRDFLLRERRLLDRLEVGLADEGYRLFHALPESALRDATPHADDLPGVYSTSVPYADTGLPMTTSLRAGALAAALLGMIASEGGAQVGGAPVREGAVGTPMIDVVHAFGQGAWPLAAGLARRLGARLIVEVFDAAMVQPATRLFNGVGAHDGRTTCLAADQPLLSALRAAMPRAAPPSAVTLARWGVHVPATARDWSRPAAARAVVLLATGTDRPGIRAALEGLGRAAADQADLLVFVDSDLCARAPVWAWAREVGLGDRLSVLAQVERGRDLVTQADVLLMPEAAGVQRTFALDAMASGMLVVARPDPMVSWLVDGQTARLVGSPSGAPPDAAAWAGALTDLLAHPDKAAALAASARQHVARGALMSGYLRDVLSAYAA